MVDRQLAESIRSEIGRKMDTLRSPDDDNLREPIAWAKEAGEQVERVMDEVDVLDGPGFAEVNFKLPSPAGAKSARDIMSHMGFRVDGLDEFTIRYPRVSEEEADKEEVIAVGESVVDRADAREYVDRVRINEAGIGGGTYWLHIQGRGLDDDATIEDIMPLLREAADAMGNRIFDARGLRAPATRADFRSRNTKRLYDRLSEIADIARVDTFADEAMIEFYAPDQDPHYPSALGVNNRGNLLEMTLRLGPLGIRDQTSREARHELEADWTDIVLDAAREEGLLDELDLDGHNIDLGDGWIAPQLRPHLRINDRSDDNDGAYNVGWREITDFLDNIFGRFERKFGTLEERRFDPDFPGAFEGDDRDMMRAPSPVTVPEPFEQVNMMGNRENVMLDFDTPAANRRLPSTVVYDDDGVTESSLRLPRLDAPEQTRNVKRRVKMLVRDANPPVEDIRQTILRLGQSEPMVEDAILIRFRDNGDSLDPHIEFDRGPNGPVIDPSTMLDFYARVFEAFQREYDMAEQMQSPGGQSVDQTMLRAEGVAKQADGLENTRSRAVPYSDSEGYAIEFEMAGDPPTTIGRNRFTSISFNEEGVTDITLRLPQAPDAYFEKGDVEELTERLRDKYNLDPAFVRFQPLVTEEYIPHIEAEKMDPGAIGLGPVEVVEAAADLLAEYNRELDRMFAPKGGMRAPEMGKFESEGDSPEAVVDFAVDAEDGGFKQVQLNNFPRQDRQTMSWSFRPIADDVLMPGVISALSVSDDEMVDEYTVRLPTLDGDKLPGSVSDAERAMEMVANDVAERAGYPRVIRVRVRTNPQSHNSKVGLTPHIEMWGGTVPFGQVADAVLDTQDIYYDAVEEAFGISLDRDEAGLDDDSGLFSAPSLY